MRGHPSKCPYMTGVPSSQVYFNVNKVYFGSQKMQFRHPDRCPLVAGFTLLKLKVKINMSLHCDDIYGILVICVNMRYLLYLCVLSRQAGYRGHKQPESAVIWLYASTRQALWYEEHQDGRHTRWHGCCKFSHSGICLQNSKESVPT